MAAYFESGFSVREPMWHGEGMVPENHPASVREAREWAGLTWDPELVPVYQRTLVPAGFGAPSDASILVPGAPDGFQAWMVPADGFQGVARNDTGALLGVPTKSFTPVTNGEMFEIAEALTAVPGAAVKFETAGSVQGGKRVYCLVYLDEPWSAPGDTSESLPFLGVVNNHDGSGACRAIYTDVRIVCWNTTEMAVEQGNRHGQQVMIRHTGNVAERIEAAKEAVAGLRDATKAWRLQAEHLAGINLSDGAVRAFLEDWIPTPDHASERLIASRAERRQLVWNVYQGALNTQDGITGTAFGLWQACSEYLDHLRAYRHQDTYLSRTMLAGDSRLKADTLAAVRRLAVSA